MTKKSADPGFGHWIFWGYPEAGFIVDDLSVGQRILIPLANAL